MAQVPPFSSDALQAASKGLLSGKKGENPCFA